MDKPQVVEKLDRETLEKEALHAECTCWYYDLADAADSMTDEDLYNIINIPFYSHLQNQIHNPVDAEEFAEEIQNCYETNYKPASKEK